MIRWLLLALAFTSCTLAPACTVTPGPLPPGPPPPAPDAGPTEWPPTCEGACGRAAELGCPFAQPTPAGTPCVQVCTDALASGLVALDLACLARMSRCEDEQSCAQRP